MGSPILSAPKMGQASVFLTVLLLAVVSGSFLHNPQARSQHPQGTRQGKQVGDSAGGAIDFTGCVTNIETGFCCIEKTESVSSLKKEPILECTHKNTEKQCQITFKKQAFNETVEHCYRPIEKVCDGQGPTECRTVYESSCTTKYVEKQPGKFVADTSCEKLPVEICGAGCSFQEGEQNCHMKTVAALVDTPEEVCDLNPQKTCRHVTKLVPKLAPSHECTIVPKETCH